MRVTRKLRRLRASAESAQEGTRAEPVRPAAPPPNKWQHAIAQIRATCDWLIGAMGAIAVAAVGSGAFLGFDRVDTWLRAGWVVWGLSMTVVGAVVVLSRATLVKLPISAGIGALIDPPEKEFVEIAIHLDTDRAKQKVPLMQEEIDARRQLDDERCRQSP